MADVSNTVSNTPRVIDLTGKTPAPTATPNSGTKRSAPVDDHDDEENLSDIDVSHEPLTENPDQIRRKIHRVIDNKELK
jgi:hypothetical protein